MSDTRPRAHPGAAGGDGMSRHSDEAVERVAARLADHDTDANWYYDDEWGGSGETFLTWDTMPEEDWTDRGMNIWTKGRDYYRDMARAALDAVDALYEDEGAA